MLYPEHLIHERMSIMQEQIKALLAQADVWLAEHQQEMIDELQGFVRIPSVSRADLAQEGAPFGPECRRALEHAVARGQHWGFEAKNHHGCAASITWGDADNALGIAAHLDVVPVGDGWVYPPFDATYLPEKELFIGRGVGDNKGPAVAGLFAMRLLRDLGWSMRHGLTLLCGASEETGMQDMKLLADKGMRFPLLTLVPDAGYPVNFAQKGSVDAAIAAPCQGNLIALDAGSVRNVIPDTARCTVTVDAEIIRQAMASIDPADADKITVIPCAEGAVIEARGVSGHAASPAASDNAIGRLARVLTASGILEGSCRRAIAEVADLTADSYGRSEGVAYSDEMSGELTLCYGVAHLRDGMLHVSADCRYSVTCDGDALESALRADWARRGYQVTHFHLGRPFYIPKDDPRVEALQALYTEITGRNDPPYAMGGGTYSRVIPNAITFGPGIPGARVDLSFLPEGHGGAHGRDEVVTLENLRVCVKMYAAALATLDQIL